MRLIENQRNGVGPNEGSEPQSRLEVSPCPPPPDDEESSMRRRHGTNLISFCAFGQRLDTDSLA